MVKFFGDEKLTGEPEWKDFLWSLHNGQIFLLVLLGSGMVKYGIVIREDGCISL